MKSKVTFAAVVFAVGAALLLAYYQARQPEPVASDASLTTEVDVEHGVVQLENSEGERLRLAAGQRAAMTSTRAPSSVKEPTAPTEAASPAFRETLEEPSGLGIVAGRVRGLQGEPVVGCEAIFLLRDAEGRAVREFAARGRYRESEPHAVTDASGEFLAGKIPVGTYTIAWRAPGYIYRAYDDPVEVHSDETTGGILQTLERAGVIWGQVVENITGRPISGAKVSAGIVSSHRHSGALVTVHTKISTFSDAKGEFRLDVLLPYEEYDLTAEHAFYMDAQAKAIPVDTGEAVRLVMMRGGSVEGEVIAEADKSPVQDAQVFAFLKGEQHKEVQSATGGHFVVRGLRPATYRFAAKSGELVTEERPEYEREVTLTGKTAPLILSLVPGGVVEFVVLAEADGGPIPEAEVRFDRVIEEEGYTGVEHYETLKTDSGGKLRLAGLEAMELRYSVRAEGYTPVLINWKDLLSVVPKETVARTIRLAPGKVIAGRVVDDQRQPVEGAEVGIHILYDKGKHFVAGVGLGWTVTGPTGGAVSSGVAESPATAVTAPDGSFVLHDLPAGYADVRVRKEGFTLGKADKVQIGSKRVKIVLHEGASLSGTTRDQQGQAVAGATVQLVWSGRGRGQGTPAQTSALSDGEGRWKIEHLDEGTYAVYARKDPLRSPLVQNLKVGLTDHMEDIRLVLHEGFTVAGRVVDEHAPEHGISDVGMYLYLQAGANVESRGSYETDAGGEFAFENLAPGNYMVYLHKVPEPYAKPGWGKNVRFAVQDRKLDDLLIHLRGGATVRGWVFLPSGEGAAQATVSPAHLYTHDLNLHEIPEQTCGLDGSFEIASLSAADGYRFLAKLAGYGIAVSEPVDLAQGEVREGVEIPLAIPGGFSGTIKNTQGSPVTEGYTVVARWPERFWPSEFGRQEPDSAGFYRMSELQPGRYTAELHSTKEQKGSFSPTDALKTVSVRVLSGEDTPGIDFVVPDKEGRTGYIAGRVVDSGGKGIANVHVSVSQIGAGVGPGVGNKGEAESDPEGAFRIENLSEGRFLLNAWFQSGGSVDLAPSFGRYTNITSPSENVEITLQRYGTVEGKVVQKESKEPVQFFRAGVDDVVRRQFETLIVFDDPGGRFRLEKIAPGSHRLRVEVEKGGAVERPLDVGDGEQVDGLVIEVGSAGAIHGRVVARKDGRPLQGATVTPASLNQLSGRGIDPTSIGTQGQAITDAGGDFTVTGISSGIETLYVEHPDYGLTEVAGIEVSEGESVEGVVVELAEPGRIQGHVYGEKGQAEPGALLLAITESHLVWKAMTDKEGHYQFPALAPGDYDLTLQITTHGDFRISRRDVDLGEGETKVIDFGQPGAVLWGTVSRRGAPVTGALVMLRRGQSGIDGSFHTSRYTGENGEYRLEGLEAGQYMLLLVDMQSRGIVAVEPIDIADKEEIQHDLLYPEGSVSGRVFQAETGKALSGVKIILRCQPLEDPAGDPFLARILMKQSFEATSDAQGEYLFENLPAGDYWLQAASGSHTGRGRSLALADGQRHDGVDLEVYAGGALRCTLRDAATGQPLRGSVLFFDEERHPVLPGASEGEASLEIQGLPPGRLLALSAPEETAGVVYGAALESIMIEAGKTLERDFLCPRGCSLTVEVRDEKGRPVYYPALELVDSAGEDRAGPVFMHFTESGNRFSLEPGTYRLAVSKRGFRSQWETIAIEPGQSALKRLVSLEPES